MVSDIRGCWYIVDLYTLFLLLFCHTSQLNFNLHSTTHTLIPISTLLSTPTSQEPTSTHKPNMLAQRTLLQASRATLSKTPTRLIHSTPKLLQAAAREEQAAHTASQRVRYWIKSLPVETYPLCKFSKTPGYDVVKANLLIDGDSRCLRFLSKFWCLFVC